jgi:lysyl-tRNA synthetase class 1
MVLRSINYYNDFIKPLKKFKTPSEQESVALNNLIKLISEQKELTTDANAYQNIVYGVGMDAGFEIKDWFKAIYQVLLGQESGPRVGSFIKIFGKENFLALCKDKNIG